MSDLDRTLITGVNGQDGTYLTELLLAAGDSVHGLCHDEAGAARLREAHPSAVAHVADLRDRDAICRIVASVEPTRIFNLAGNTSVARSWQFPMEAAEVLGVGPVRLLEEAWALSERSGKQVRFLQASSAEIFGDATEFPQHEKTPRKPVTPYGAAKAFAHEMVAMYRRRGMHASSAILYNHESPRRPETFVARKIALGVARISLGLQDQLTLGNIDVRRDWGYAPDYVEALVRIVEHSEGEDFIVATGESHSVREFVSAAFEHVGIGDWEQHVVIDPDLYRPADPQQLVGDPSRLKAIGWRPTVGFEQLVAIMVGTELDRLAAGESQ